MAYTRSSIPDLTGRTAVVTGANGGLGLATAKALAGAGAHVVMAARDQDKAAAAVDVIRADSVDPSLEVVALDLGSLASVAQAAEAILAEQGRIDILVNNAGVMAMPEQQTADGFEMQLGINHLGHWALTAHLLPALLAADRGRVVAVTSVARYQGRRLDPENPHLRGNYDPWRAYGQSKLANYHFALGLQRAFERAGASAMSLVAHPGLTNSDLQATTHEAGAGGVIGTMSNWMAPRFGMSIDEGALPQVRAATDPQAEGGELYGPRFVTNGAAVRRPVLRPGADESIRVLWEVSERETGIPLEVA